MLCSDFITLLWSKIVQYIINLLLMTVKGGTTPACAACKYQRRRCVPTCPLAPYFPANQPKTFQNVHRLFGVSNVTKTLKALQTENQRDDAMKSIIFEADMRESYPVHGCSTLIFQLKFQLHYAYEELKYLHAQLAKCREQVNKQVVPWTTQQELTAYSMADSMPVLYNNQSVVNSDAPEYLVNENNGFYGDSYDHLKQPLLELDPFDGISNNSNNLMVLQTQMDSFGIQGRETLMNHQEYEGIPFNMIDDDRQSYIETTEPCESCSESSQKGSNITSVQQVCENELRNAAAGFSLTTMN